MHVRFYNGECQIHKAVTTKDVIRQILWQLRWVWIHKSIFWPPLKIYKSSKTEWILEKDLDYRFILPKTKMNRSSLIHWLLTAQAGSELNLKMMKLKQMIHFKVRLDAFSIGDWNIFKKWSFLKTGLRNRFRGLIEKKNQQSI